MLFLDACNLSTLSHFSSASAPNTSGSVPQYGRAEQALGVGDCQKYDGRCGRGRRGVDSRSASFGQSAEEVRLPFP